MIVFYQGRRGAGKTLTMVKDGLRFKLNDWNIYSNIKVEFEHTLLSSEEIINIKKSDIQNCVLMIDEIQILLDSRRGMKKSNIDFSAFIQQIRKRNIIILCTTQYSNNVDLRFRQHVDIIARPRYLKRYNVVEVVYMDITTEDEYDTAYNIDSMTIVYNPSNIFGLYNTNTIIKGEV